MHVTDILKKWPHYKCPRCGLEQLLIGYYKENPAQALGKLGGKVKSERKAAASRENGKKGGRPRKLTNPKP